MKKGAVWHVNLDPAMGAEIKKIRPCVILNNNKIGRLPLKIVAPLTDFKEHYRKVPWMVITEPTRKNGLSKISVIDVFQIRSVSQKRLQIRSVSQKRLVKKLGIVDDNILEACKQALDIVLKREGNMGSHLE